MEKSLGPFRRKIPLKQEKQPKWDLFLEKKNIAKFGFVCILILLNSALVQKDGKNPKSKSRAIAVKDLHFLRPTSNLMTDRVFVFISSALSSIGPY